MESKLRTGAEPLLGVGTPVEGGHGNLGGFGRGNQVAGAGVTGGTPVELGG